MAVDFWVTEKMLGGIILDSERRDSLVRTQKARAILNQLCIF